MILGEFTLSRKRQLISGIDPDALSYIHVTGALDRLRVSNFTRISKQLFGWSNFAAYLAKSSQNFGSGNVLKTLGGLGTDMTLVASPTWQASGLLYNGTTQYGTSSDFLNGGTQITFAARFQQSVDATSRTMFTQLRSVDVNQRSWQISTSGGNAWQTNISENGALNNLRTFGVRDLSWHTIVVSFNAGTYITLLDGVAQTIATGPASWFNSTAPVTIASNDGLVAFFNGTIQTCLVAPVALDAAGCLALSNAINALD